MDSQTLKAAQAPWKEKYQVDPNSAFQTMSAAGVIHFESLSVQTDYAGPNWNELGMHVLAGGDGLAACASEMLLYSLVGCAGVTFAAVATSMGLEMTSAKIEVEGDLDFRGTLAVTRDTPVGFQAIRVLFLISSPAEDSKLTKLVQLSERYCVVAQTLQHVSASWKRA